MIKIAPGPISEEIGRRLVAHFAPIRLQVIDESEGHRGHGNHREGIQTHLAIVIEATAFAGLSRVSAQRLVHKLLTDLMDPPVGNGPVHALTVTTASS
jgi:BolA family transcriptional regulator, general stress-responsive regulator